VTWHLEPNALEALRDQLIERGTLIERRTALRRGAASSHADGPHAANTLEAETLLRRVAPFLELLYLMMVADGKCDERERQLLRGVTRTLGGADLSNASVDRLLTAFDAHMIAEGVHSRLETVASVLCADRLDAEAAFTLTATMALADGDVDVPEHTVLSELAELLGISASRARELAAQAVPAQSIPTRTGSAP
jgi:DnaJ-domain-containing protein 1